MSSRADSLTGDLTTAERVELLRLARSSLESAVQGLKRPPGPTGMPSLEEHRGAFVTLTSGGELRGCIGFIRGSKPVWQAVSQMAVQAGLHDPRFRPVSTDELESLRYEISVLTPLEKVADVSAIQVGRHGLMIVMGFHSGLLLPQVASEYGWDRETFLDQTCLKAGLSAGSWRQGVDIYSFSAQVFSEASEGLR
ncbi:MAG: AmmeMemoRadiSam system protein A [Candidatus Wallbacteria bacterium]|nr:AmmeMemoRadiSam system protein A [Candidatus Wallbacteria bacterium]